MVRPWMVAFLVLLTGRRSSGVGPQSSSPPPVAASHDGAAIAGEDLNATDIASIGCYYKGRSYEAGTLVTTDQPCLKCTCVTGSLVCHLQVCPEMPDPPPQGCVIVHKKTKCCAHLQCNYEQFGAVYTKLFSLQTDSRSGPARMENSAIVTFDGFPKGCVVNGTVYAEGSAMDSSSLCEYCYCIKGNQQCVRPHCSLTIPGCAAVYKKHTCCPIRYKCSPQNPLIENTTDTPTTTEMASSLYSHFKDCRINGRLISLGEPVFGVARSSCETCFCINGRVRCDKVICPPIRARISPNCGPVYTEGHCCPTSYDCTANATATATATTTPRNNEILHVSSTTSAMTTAAEAKTTTTTPPPSTVTVPDDNVVRLNSSPMTSAILTKTESTLPAFISNSKTTTESTTDDPMESRHANPAGLVLDEFGSLNLNVTEKSNNFEMDYDEPTLPPSLPNLKIIPFVAADAVVDEPAPVYDNYQPVVERVYNVSDIVEEQPPSLVINSFSPPIETEGGFVPKDSPVGTVELDKMRTTSERVPIQQTTDVRLPDKFVVDHQPTGPGWCAANGKKYKHGELLTDPSACDICVCFNAKIVCQENCPAVKVGCQRVRDPNNSTCCGRIVCDESENDLTASHEDRLTESPSTESPMTATKTKDSVIEHIVYSAPPTERPAPSGGTRSPATVKPAAPPEPTASTTARIPATSTVERTASTVLERTTSTVDRTASTAKPVATRPPVSVTVKAPTPIEPAEIASTTSKPAEDEDYSFESMFSFLFSGDTASEQQQQQQPSSGPPKTSSAKDRVDDGGGGGGNRDAEAAETRIEHRTDDETDEKDARPDGDFASLFEQLFVDDRKSNVEPPRRPVEVKSNTETGQRGPEVVEDRPQQTDVEIDAKENTRVGTAEHRDETTSKPFQQKFDKHRTEVSSEKPADVGTLSGVKQTEPKPHSPTEFALEHSGGPAIMQQQPQQQLHQLQQKQQQEHQHQQKYQHQQQEHQHQQQEHQHQHQQQEHQHQHQQQEHQHQQKYQHQQQTGLKPNVVQTSKIPPKLDADSNSTASMLRISGCNIYGRMYGVGKIIPELSTPCLQCMCTNVGVHCSQLKC